MKEQLTKTARKLLPSGALKLLESSYRKGRVRVVSTRYGKPAKHLRVIAITGTNGKTTTAVYVNEILKEAKFKTAMFTTALIEVAGKAKVNDLNATVASTAGRPVADAIDVPDTWADIDDLAREVGYTPATTVAVGIRNFVDWYLEYYRDQGPPTPRVVNLG